LAHDNWARLRRILEDILSDRSARVWVFGSRAKGTARLDSDLDLVIDMGAPLPRALRHQLLEAFESSDLPYPVDLVDWWTISDSFRAMIAGDRILVWEQS
jgi:predicted nucleotidyltransferase